MMIMEYNIPTEKSPYTYSSGAWVVRYNGELVSITGNSIRYNSYGRKDRRTRGTRIV